MKDALILGGLGCWSFGDLAAVTFFFGAGALAAGLAILISLAILALPTGAFDLEVPAFLGGAGLAAVFFGADFFGADFFGADFASLTFGVGLAAGFLAAGLAGAFAGFFATAAFFAGADLATGLVVFLTGDDFLDDAAMELVGNLKRKGGSIYAAGGAFASKNDGSTKFFLQLV